MCFCILHRLVELSFVLTLITAENYDLPLHTNERFFSVYKHACQTPQPVNLYRDCILVTLILKIKILCYLVQTLDAGTLELYNRSLQYVSYKYPCDTP